MKSRTGARRTALAMIACLLLVGGLLAAPAVSANGKPVTVYLGYLPEVSNWGPYEAGGEAYVCAGEGHATITVDHMPVDPTIRYEVWLVSAEDRTAFFSVGTFAVDDAGHAQVELVSANLVSGEYRFVIVTAEPYPDPDPAPDSRRAVAGIFPNSMARTPSAELQAIDDIWAQSPTGEAGGEAAAGEEPASGAPHEEPVVAPPRLPVTGGRPNPLAEGATVAAGIASIGLLVAGGRRRRLADRARRALDKGGAR